MIVYTYTHVRVGTPISGRILCVYGCVIEFTSEVSITIFMQHYHNTKSIKEKDLRRRSVGIFSKCENVAALRSLCSPSGI